MMYISSISVWIEVVYNNVKKTRFSSWLLVVDRSGLAAAVGHSVEFDNWRKNFNSRICAGQSDRFRANGCNQSINHDALYYIAHRATDVQRGSLKPQWVIGETLKRISTISEWVSSPTKRSENLKSNRNVGISSIRDTKRQKNQLNPNRIDPRRDAQVLT